MCVLAISHRLTDCYVGYYVGRYVSAPEDVEAYYALVNITHTQY